MTDQAFEQRFQQIEQETARRQELADAYKDQAMALLFLESNWTQERLAKRMGKKRVWVDRHLRLGRFLNWLDPTGIKTEKPPESLTERRFRSCWEKTRGSGKRKGKEAEAEEHERFAQVLTMLSEHVPPGYKNLQKKPGIRQAIREECGDGKWYTVHEILASVESLIDAVDIKSVTRAMNDLQRKPPRGYLVESRHSGRKYQYRLTNRPDGHADAPPEVLRLYEEVRPLIDELDVWGKTHELRMSPRAIQVIAVKMRRLFDSILKESRA